MGNLLGNTAPIAVQQIFNQLKASKGILSTQAPHLRVVDQLPNSSLAIAMATTDSIFIDQASVDICKTMGADSTDALAFILSHELAHYVLGHEDRHKFLRPLQNSQRSEIMRLAEVDDRRTSRRLGSVLQKYAIRNNEVEADLEAGFLSYLAGYRPLTAGAKFLDLAYAHYGLSDEEGKYSSLQQRKQMITETAQMLDSLTFIFEASNFALLTDHRAMARHGYSYISKYFQSADLLNNLAALEIIEYGQIYSEIMIYELPLTISDPSSPVFSENSPTIGTEEEMRAFIALEKRNFLLESKRIDEIIGKLDKALEINPEFIPAYVNKSIAYYLRHLRAEECMLYRPPSLTDQFEYAEASLLQAKNILLNQDSPSSQQLIGVYNMLAIINDMRRDESKAQEWLSRAAQLDSASMMTAINRDVINGNVEGRIDAMLSSMDRDLSATEAELVDYQGARKIELAHFGERYDGMRLDSLVSSSTLTNWIEKEIAITSKNAILPQRIVLAYTQTDRMRCYQWRKVKGRSQIEESTTYIKPVNTVDEVISLNPELSFISGDRFDQIVRHIGRGQDMIQTTTHTYHRYPNCLLMTRDSRLDGWVHYR